MVEWDRRTPWRQGHILSDESVLELQLVSPEKIADFAVVVISHDCDLTQPPKHEPVVEVIVAQRIEKLDGNFTHGKNPRRLHLAFEDDADTICLELVASKKRDIQKEKLAYHAPNNTKRLKLADQCILQRWLVRDIALSLS